MLEIGASGVELQAAAQPDAAAELSRKAFRLSFRIRCKFIQSHNSGPKNHGWTTNAKVYRHPCDSPGSPKQQVQVYRHPWDSSCSPKDHGSGGRNDKIGRPNLRVAGLGGVVAPSYPPKGQFTTAMAVVFLPLTVETFLSSSSLKVPLLAKSADSAELAGTKVPLIAKSADSAELPGGESLFKRQYLTPQQTKELQGWLAMIYSEDVIEYWLSGVPIDHPPAFIPTLLGKNPTISTLSEQYNADRVQEVTHLTKELKTQLDKFLNEITTRLKDDRTSAIVAQYLRELGSMTPIRGSKNPLKIAIWEYIQKDFMNIAEIVDQRNRPMFYALEKLCQPSFPKA
ncbi:hypothetical protein PCASD_08860 [Puccinia coronata f. sp. avenae]|uniref:Uncharacterized protein n=1 Tax=Puccinia coronata f. sp. avenae TaxID=200324 RepID=A0A2N5URV0_9BASI|nr:hypothetical protein PCASD_08860 [Puccinia coronata f. sp. avenae]